MRSRLIALGVSVVLLAIGGSAPAFAQSTADQSADNSADSQASNSSSTTQGATQDQSASSSCQYGCGGSGQAQNASQSSSTNQSAGSSANANQNGVNANVPVTISGGGVSVGGMNVGRPNGGGSSSATQNLDNDADSDASNEASTTQDASQNQSSSSSCQAGCGGSGQHQGLDQDADTDQEADSEARADQNGVNANVPVTIGGGDVRGGNSSANQDLKNEADSDASNKAWTEQNAGQTQDSSSECKYGCGGSGQSQKLDQDADTKQKADSKAYAWQNGVNANVPVTIGGGDVRGGDTSADQELDNEADSDASNKAGTEQNADQTQDQLVGLQERLWRLRPVTEARPGRRHQAEGRVEGQGRAKCGQRQRAGLDRGRRRPWRRLVGQSGPEERGRFGRVEQGLDRAERRPDPGRQRGLQVRLWRLRPVTEARPGRRHQAEGRLEGQGRAGRGQRQRADLDRWRS